MNTFQEVLDYITPKLLRTDFFVGESPLPQPRIFGGQVLAQSIMASDATVEDDRSLHSLHGNFLRPGNTEFPLEIKVERVRDGQAFSTRRVDIFQNGKIIFIANLNYHTHEVGDEHQIEAEEIPPAPRMEKCASNKAEMSEETDRPDKSRFTELFCFDRWVVTERKAEPQEPKQMCWFRGVDTLRDDPKIHRAAIAMVSDYALLSTSLLPYPVINFHERYNVASLDHAIWFHNEARADEFMLYSCDSPWAGASRGFNRGQFRTEAGKLICSTAQENLMRLR